MQRILILAEGQLGDLLLLTPALRAIRETFPAVFLSVLVLDRRPARQSNEAPSLFDVPRESCPLSTNKNVDELILVSRPLLREARGLSRLKRELSVIRMLRSKTFDTVVSTFPEDRFAQWAFLSGADSRVGQRKQSLQFLLTHKPALEKTQHGVLEYYCDLARAIGATVHSKMTEYCVPGDSQYWAEREFQRHSIAGNGIVAVHPGASGDYKIWPPERFAELIAALRKRTQVVLLHGPMDAEIMREIRSRLREPVPGIEVGNNVGNLAAALQRSSLCVSNDSGPRHLAVAVGTPSLALFRHHHDREWGAYGESEKCAIMKGEGRCAACPPDACLDKVPDGERFGSYCLRMLAAPEVIRRVETALGLPLSGA